MSRAEEEWMRRFQDGDDGAFLLLFQRFHRPLFRCLAGILGRTDLAEEATQEVFLTLYEKRDVYERGSIRAWLYTLARNRGLRLRERGARELPRENPGRSLAAQDDDPEGSLLKRERAAEVREALKTLQESRREVICLRELAGLSYAEIAEATGRTRAAVRNDLHRARRDLRDLLDDGDDCEETA